MSALIRFGHVFLVQTFPYSSMYDQLVYVFEVSSIFLYTFIRKKFRQKLRNKKPPFCQVAMMPQTCGEMASGRLTASWCWGKHGKARSIPWQTTSLIYFIYIYIIYIIYIYYILYILYILYIYFIYIIYRLSILKDFEPPFERYIIQIHTAYLCIFHFKAKIKCYWS